MYSCPLHQWNSYESPCPSCHRTVTVSTTEITTGPVQLVVPESPTTADASVLKEALEYLINDIKSKPSDTRYATAIKKATEALAQYSTQSLPDPNPSFGGGEQEIMWRFCIDNILGRNVSSQQDFDKALAHFMSKYHITKK